MNLKRLSLLTLSVAGCVNFAFSTEKPPIFRPTFSLMGTYTYTRNFNHLNDGKFTIGNRKGNFGLELSNKFYATESHFVKTGIRFQQYSKTITAINQVPEIYDYPAPFAWELRYASVSVPVLIGKDFTTRGGTGGDFYFGIAPGILMNTFKRIDGEVTKHRDPNDTDPVFSTLWDDETELPNFFFVTADLGMTIRPVKAIPGFTMGALCSFQLNKAQRSKHQGVVTVPDKGYDFLYELYNENRVMNFSLLFSYTFGKNV